MNQLIECVPNFSEGRNNDVIEEIIQPFKETKGCAMLDYRADRDHNRLVVSLVGRPDPVQDALIQAAKAAVARIDLEKHQGGHPRIGAVDVIPFVPLRNITMEACVTLARDFGRRYYRETGVPVYFYETAALRPERRRLEVIRKGQFEALKIEVADPQRHPDVGEPRLHPSAGATVIGARKFLIAFNANLGTDDIEVARRIAEAVRASSGGLCHVKGIGLALEERGLVQVSMNIVDYEKNALYRVVELIRMEAKRWGVSLVETEVYGMIPAAALLDSAAYYMQLAGFDASQVVELRLLEMLGREE
ncbi:MAG: glutamate formimidoyltransferase [Deltaproteobacteria bacterium]|nr:glutamate formimidoyltransferase [Deltaproteobacteria bacterium]MBW1954374.1 glutamate formimidoyltransferase [Deltaproteobacteria bacterium]MBW2041526.1 glutamate formimidoyltransferase [Deltaproteobacteria bacterium]MBW2131584.1 glutamate formimidoyltransferase [Deltaproteobacteria bacterium]